MKATRCYFPSANTRHTYSFPRIYAIMNDGKLQYDVGKDGQDQEIGSCAVSICSLLTSGTVADKISRARLFPD